MAGRLQYESVRAMREMQSPRGLGLTTLTIGGVDYPYLPGKSTFAQGLGTGGFSLDTAAVFIVERGLLETLPKANTLLTDNDDGKKYRIQTVNDSADGSHISIECVDAAQGL
jgi:hypothetical protein